ncbi:MAG: hypothetical protein IJG13_22610 [Kiritimatiellae bacterium]|nr:hypothetical protein [Kiritimatiellia bacterium]
MAKTNEMAGVSGAMVCVMALVAAGCCDCATGAKPLVDIPQGHKPQVIMGRDCWRVLDRYTAYGWAGKFVARDNPEFNADPAVADVVPCYVAAANPPPPETGLAVWPKLEDYFRPGAPDREILTSNPLPDRPFFLTKRSERFRSTWGSPVSVDMPAYRAWRAAHPNLVVDGGMGEWCNDLDNAWATLAGRRGTYCDDRPDSSNRVAALARFLGTRPKTRYEHVDLLKRYFAMRKERNFGGTMAVLDAHLNTLHIAGDLGAALVRMETTRSGQYRYQPTAMFTRGAARQFGVPWEWYIAGYVNGPSKFGKGYLGDAICRYPATAEATGEPHYAEPREAKWAPGGTMRQGNSGPDFGISRSLFKRTHYLAYLSGANYIQLEEWNSGIINMWDKAQGKTVFSPRGKIYAEFARFMREHPDRGAHYSPVAVCVPLAQGYPTWGGAPFANPAFGYTAGDKAVDAVFYTLVPGCDYSVCRDRGEEKCLRNSPYADMYDVIAPDATSQTPERLLAVMKSYKALVVVGDYRDTSWEKTLAQYEAEGGRVVRVGPDTLADAVTTGKGRSIAHGEVRYPRLEAALNELQDAYFPFAVDGDCAYGLTAADDHVWLYVFNNAGVTKFADAPEELDASKTTDVKGALRPGKGCVRKVTELLSGKDVAVADGASFGCQLGPGELAVFEIR